MTRRSKSRALWQRVSAGDFDNDLLEWLRVRASELLAADDFPAAKRRDGIVRALDLQYRQNPHSHVADTVNLVRSFQFLGEDGQERASRRGEETQNMIFWARRADPSWKELGDDEVRKRLARMFARKV